MNILNKLPHDKALHMVGGVLIYAVAIAFALPGLIAVGIVAVVAVAKEIKDKLGTGTPDVWDAVATVALPAVVALAYYIKQQGV